MAITVELMNNGVSGNLSQRTAKYLVRADSDIDEDAAMLAAIDFAPTVIDNGTGLALIGVDAAIDGIYWTQNGTLAFVTVSWSMPEAGSKFRPTDSNIRGEETYDFSYQAPTGHIEFALSTTKYGTNAPEFGNRIRCRYDGPDLIVDGVDLPSGSPTDTWKFNCNKGFITPAYRDLVVSMMGGVNVKKFAGRPIGTMRLVSVQSSIVKHGSQNVSWGFQFNANRTNVTIGGITGVNIGGHDIWWALDEKNLDAVNGKIILKERAIYVQQIFPLVDMDKLNFNPR
jgi:hypothetical protein